MTQSTFTVPASGTYTKFSNGGRYKYHLGDVIPLDLAVDLQMPGASAPVVVSNTPEALRSAIDSEAARILVPGDIAKGAATAAIGDSITIANSTSTYLYGIGWFVLASLMSGGKIFPLLNAGVGGNTTAQMLARIQADVIAFKTSLGLTRCFVLGGSNDVAAAVTTQQTMANLTAMYDALRAAGIEPIACTIPPRSDGFHGAIARLNAAIQGTAIRRGLKMVDFYSVLVDPANGNYKSGLAVGDGVHPTLAGYKAMATELNTKITPVLPLATPLLTVDKSDNPVAGLGANLLVNGVFITDTNADGVADGWTISAANGTVTPTIETGDAAIIGNWQVLTVTVNGIRSLDQVVAAGPNTFAPGDTLVLKYLMTTSGNEASGQQVLTRVLPTGGVLTGISALLNHGADLVRSQPYLRFTVGAGVTSLNVQLCITGSVLGTGVIKLAQATLLNLTKLGLA